MRVISIPYVGGTTADIDLDSGTVVSVVMDRASLAVAGSPFDPNPDAGPLSEEDADRAQEIAAKADWPPVKYLWVEAEP